MYDATLRGHFQCYNSKKSKHNRLHAKSLPPTECDTRRARGRQQCARNELQERLRDAKNPHFKHASQHGELDWITRCPLATPHTAVRMRQQKYNTCKILVSCFINLRRIPRFGLDLAHARMAQETISRTTTNNYLVHQHSSKPIIIRCLTEGRRQPFDTVISRCCCWVMQ